MIYAILLAILLVALVLLLAWQLLRWLPAGADRLKPLPYVIALLPIAPFCAALGLVASAVAAVATRSQNEFYKSYLFLCVAYALLFVISLKSYTPYWAVRLLRIKQEKSPESSLELSLEKSREIRVMTLNCRYGRANASQIIKLAKTHKIDTILLQEVSKKLVKNLEKLGIKRDFAHVQLGSANGHENGGFNAIYTRLSNVKSFGKSIKIDAANVPIVTAVTCDSSAENLLITFASAHPKSPMRGCAAWSSGIMALAKIGENHNKSNVKKITIIGGR